jgi:hypothetical protein
MSDLDKAQDEAAIAMAIDAYTNRFNGYLLLRMFVGGYAQVSDDMFLQAVDKLLSGFKKDSLSTAFNAMKKYPGDQVDVERLRIQHVAAINEFVNRTRGYMIGLRNAMKAPGEPKL